MAAAVPTATTSPPPHAGIHHVGVGTQAEEEGRAAPSRGQCGAQAGLSTVLGVDWQVQCEFEEPADSSS
jgi:hypothetical protein